MKKFLFVSLALSLWTNVLIADRDSIQIVAYNVENLLDTIDNVATDDDAFTPDGEMRWTGYRLRQKCARITSVISEIGQMRWPEIVGLVEVENPLVMEELLDKTILRKRGYQYIITRGKDPRGINIALLYRQNRISIERWQGHTIPFSDTTKRSRDLLYAQLRLPNEETLHTFVVHLPSRRGGALLTERYRREVCLELRRLCDSIHMTDKEAHILLMGDFNGEPSERATRTDLSATLDIPREYLLAPPIGQLYNLINPSTVPKDEQYGTYCFRGVWSQLDQFIISGSMLGVSSRVRYRLGSAHVFAPEMIRHGALHSGQRAPWRTYGGTYYFGGYSDHFPIVMLLDLE